MTGSIRLRLFLILLLATAAVWGGAALWTRAAAEARIERVLDARLSEAARMVTSLMADGRVAVADAVDVPDALTSAAVESQEGYEHRLSCQIWSLAPGEDRLVSRSEGAPWVGSGPASLASRPRWWMARPGASSPWRSRGRGCGSPWATRWRCARTLPAA